MEDTMKHPRVIDQELAKELVNYKGRWVAVDNRHVAASGSSATEAVEAARGVGVADPLVFRVSAHPERLNLL